MTKEKKDKSPAFQWYPKDVLTDTRVMEMDLATEGAYRRALDICWLSGRIITADPKRLALLIGKGCKVKTASAVIELFTKNEDGTMHHKRLDQEWQKQQEWASKSSSGGKKGAETRWRKPNQDDDQGITTPITTPTPPDDQGCNQSMTLQSSVSSLHTSSDDDVSPASTFSEKSQLTDFQKRKHAEFGAALLADVRYAEERTIICTDNTIPAVTGDHIRRFVDQLTYERKAHLSQQQFNSHFRPWMRKGENAKPQAGSQTPTRKKLN